MLLRRYYCRLFRSASTRWTENRVLFSDSSIIRRNIMTTKDSSNDEDEDELAMREFLERLKSERAAKNQSSATLSSQLSSSSGEKDSIFNTLLEFATKSSDNGEQKSFISFTADLAELKRPSSVMTNEIGNQIVESTSNRELKDGILGFINSFFLVPPNPNDIINRLPSPKLLACIIAKCRKLKCEGMAYSLIQFIKDKGVIHYATWFNVHVYNEILFMDWELHRDMARLEQYITEMIDNVIIPNSFTVMLMERVKTNGFNPDLDVLHWNRIIAQLRSSGISEKLLEKLY